MFFQKIIVTSVLHRLHHPLLSHWPPPPCSRLATEWNLIPTPAQINVTKPETGPRTFSYTNILRHHYVCNFSVACGGLPQSALLSSPTLHENSFCIEISKSDKWWQWKTRTLPWRFWVLLQSSSDCVSLPFSGLLSSIMSTTCNTDSLVESRVLHSCLFISH